ncbi:MAG: ABC-F family ATP-binding cassette domain-containing protein [Bacteroidota bacterium]|jgi:ATP-binding cassette subfamily F protein uup
MNVLSVERIAKSFGIRELFTDLSFGIEQGQKVALVAKNGTGKSTLLQLLTGKDSPDEGKIVFNKEIRWTFLEQDEAYLPENTALDYLLASNNAMTQAIRLYESALVTGEHLERALDQMDQSGAWDYDSKMKQVLGALNIQRLEQTMGTMSGGQRRRIALAKVLLEDADFLILDEPTNHLDLDMIEWLEDYLGKSNKTLFMVTHDRYFLENITDEILELENKTLYKYKGNFSYYLEKKAEREQLEAATRDKQENLFRKEAEWARKMPRARGTKSKSRLDAFQELKETLAKKKEAGELDLEINISRMGSKVVEFHRVKKQLGQQTILDGFDYTFKSNERVGLVGRNGCGKTTFLQLLTKRDEPDHGKVVNGETVVFGYYEQSTMHLKPEQRVIECIREIADFIPLKKGKTITASQLLEKFLFPKHMHFNTISQLSGGEKKRLQLLLILMKNPNFLILDEPTNDLDIFTLSALEDYLSQYPGCLLIVSHDRYFLDKLVDHLFVLDGKGGVRDVLGSSLQFRDMLAESSPENVKEKESIEPKTKNNSTTKISFKEKQQFTELERDIPLWEEKRVQLELQMSQCADHSELIELSNQLAELNSKIEEGTLLWLTLAEKMG